MTGGGVLPCAGCLASAVTGGGTWVNTYDDGSPRRRDHEGSLPLGRARRRRGVCVDGVPGHAVSPWFVLLLIASQASDGYRKRRRRGAVPGADMVGQMRFVVASNIEVRNCLRKPRQIGCRTESSAQ